jgi:hypothetical protein
MRKNNIDNLVKKLLEESLQEKADELVGKINSKMNEVEDGDGPTPEMLVSKFCDSKSPDYDEKSCEYHKAEFGEGLIGGQKKLDKNKNGKLDSQDFKMLRGETNEGKDMCSECGGMMYEGECSECGSKWMTEDFDFSFNDEIKESKTEKWIQDTDMKKGSLHKKLGVPEGEKLSVSKLKSLKKELSKKGEGDKKLSKEDSKLLKQVNLALTLKNIKESKKENLRLSESEMIELIEKIVMEEKKAKGMAETEKVLSANKKENEKAIADVTKKMKEYLKMGHEGDYETNPENFPLGNGQIKRQNAMKYVPSDAVEEYIDAFAHPGQTNLTFDEIKPDDKKIDKYLKGDSTTGNAVKDKKGKALGNVVPSKTGEKFKKNFDENLYGAEQKNASYKRQSQPVDVTGDSLQKGHLKGKSSSASKAQKVLDNVDESTKKETKVLNEEFDKMKHLMGYNKKTQ